MTAKMDVPDYVNEQELEERLGENGLHIMEKKYLKRDDHGTIIEMPAERLYTVAKEVASVEKSYGKSDGEVESFTREFYEAMANKFFSPGGRIVSNVGTELGALFNCYVLPIPDDLEGIYEQLKNAAIIHKKGGGTGYNFSNVRPRGKYVKTSRGVASGPVSFAGQFDKETEVINSGNRRGANMGILDIYHPDIIEWIHSKTTEGQLANFNISVGITDEFMRAVENDGYYTLMFNDSPFEAETLEGIIRNLEKNMGAAEVGSKPVPPSLKIQGDKVFDTYWNEEIGRIDENKNVQLKARIIFNRIGELAHQTADPGVVFLDNVNEDNPLPSEGKIEATNPCGEQPLHPYDACNLGSINLAEMIKYEDGNARADFERIKAVTRTAVRFLDNCNDLNKGPIDRIEETVKRHRRIGLGVMGWADMLARLEISYDSDSALKLAEEVMKTITDESHLYSEKLAEEKGAFSDFEKSTYAQRGDKPRRNLLSTTIAPTGTISMLYFVSSGIEPFYAVIFYKNMRGGDKMKTLLPTFVEAMKKRSLNVDADLEKKIDENKGGVQGLEGVPEDVQRIFKGAYEISTERHILMQAAFQRHLDNAVSKTINLPENATVDDVKKAYKLAWKTKCKGITVYRDNTKNVQVLETVAVETSPNIHYVDVSMPNKNIEHNDTVTHYKIKRGDERIHVLFASRLFKAGNNDYYFLPDADFQVTKPIGTELAGELAQSGIDRTHVLQGPDPDYVEFIRDLKSVRGDRSFDMGENRIDSPSHAIGLCIEHLLLKQGVLKYEANTEMGIKRLVQVVRKKDLQKLSHDEEEEIVKKWRFSEKAEDRKGEIHLRGNRDLGIRFKCVDCGETNYFFREGCSDPVCRNCGWSKGKCD